MALKYVSTKSLDNNRLSLEQNLTRRPVKLESKTILSSQLKSILIVYIATDNRKFIDKSAAYALNLTNFMNDGIDLFEISDYQLRTMENRNFEIEYRQISSEDVPKREAIKVFFDGIDYYIELSAAYFLGLIRDENFFKMNQQLYKISENIFLFLNNKYDVDKIIIQDTKAKKYK